MGRLNHKPTWFFFFQRYPRQVILTVVLLILAGIIESVGAVSIVPLLGGLVEGSHASSPFLEKVRTGFLFCGIKPTMGAILTVIGLAMAGKAVLSLAAMQQAGNVEADVVTDLRLGLVDNLLKARWGYYVSQSSGELSNALINEAVRAGVALRAMAQALALFIQAMVYLWVGMFVSWELLLAGLVCGCLFAFAFKGLIRVVRQAGERQTKSLDSMNASFTDALAGAKPLKVMGAEEGLMRYVRAQAEEYKQAARRHVLGVGVMTSVQEPALTVMLCAGFFAAISYLDIDPATLLAMAFFFHRILSRFSSVQQNMQIYAGLESSLLSLLTKIDAIQQNTEMDRGVREHQLADEAQLKGVTVRYGDKQVLHSIDISIRVGRITALCGPSGSGKTTAADVLTGLVQPDEGEVLLDNVSLSEIGLHSWRKQIGYVPQEVFLFNDTIRANLVLDRECSDEELWSILERSGAADFVGGTEKGLETVVGEHGRALSGGQRQRLMIARALVSRPRLLILDESTTGLDEATERAILKTLNELKKDMAVCVISHQQAVMDIADTTYDVGAAR